MRTNYHIDKFVDNKGIEREFIIAAVSIDLRKDKSVLHSMSVISFDDYDMTYGIDKVLCIGIAVRRPEDTYDENLGMKIAEGKALKALSNPSKGKLLFASDAGLVNTKMVQALLEQEALHFKHNPSSYISGYKKQSK